MLFEQVDDRTVRIKRSEYVRIGDLYRPPNGRYRFYPDRYAVLEQEELSSIADAITRYNEALRVGNTG